MAVPFFFSCVFCLALCSALCSSFASVSSKTGDWCPKSDAYKPFMNTCIYIRVGDESVNRSQASENCDLLASPRPDLKWRLPKLDSWSKIKNLTASLPYEMSLFWIDLRRESEPTNPNEWNDPSKWRWESDQTALEVESFKKKKPPWVEKRNNVTWCQPQQSRTCALARWNRAKRSMLWIDFCDYPPKCLLPYQKLFLVCEMYAVEPKNSTSVKQETSKSTTATRSTSTASTSKKRESSTSSTPADSISTTGKISTKPASSISTASTSPKRETSTSATLADSTSKVPKTSTTSRKRPPNVDPNDGDPNSRGSTKGPKSSSWPYIVLGLCGAVAIASVVVIVAVVYRRRRNRGNVGAGRRHRRKSPDRKKDRQHGRSRSPNALRSKSHRRQFGISSRSIPSQADDSLSIFANSQSRRSADSGDSSGLYMNSSPKTKKTPKQKKTGPRKK